jgi:hypothetical protein
MYLREYEVQRDDFRLLCHHELQASGAVQRGSDVIPMILQVFAVTREETLVKVDEYDPAGHIGSGSGKAGMT